MTTPVPPERDAKTGQYIKGKIGGPGRGKGTRNRLGEAFLEALEADFNDNGKSAIENCRVVDPAGYVRVIAGLLPKELKIERGAMDELSDDELSRLIDIIRTADGASVAPRSGNEAQGGGKPSGELPTIQ